MVFRSNELVEGAIAMELKQRLERIGYRAAMIVDNGDNAIPIVASLRPDGEVTAHLL